MDIRDENHSNFISKNFKYEDSTNAENFASEDLLDTIFKQNFKKKNSDIKYRDIAKNISMDNTNEDSQIKISTNKIRAYLKNYNDLGRLIKYRENMIIQGRGENLDEWKSNSKMRVDNQAIILATDYKIKEMKFYKENLTKILQYLRKYIFISYQFIYLFYFKKMPKEYISKALNINNIEHFDNMIINYIIEYLTQSSACQLNQKKDGGK